MKKLISSLTLFLVVSLIILHFSMLMEGSENSFEQLYSTYMNAEKWQSSSEILRQELLEKAGPKTPVDLWWSLWDLDSSGEQRAANAP